MIALWIIAIVFLCGVLVLTSYIERTYAEAGKLLSREFDENIDAYVERVEPKLGKDPRRISTSIGLLSQIANATITLLLAFPVFHGEFTRLEVVQLIVGLILILLIFNRIIPFLLFTRTKGVWLARFTPVLIALLWLISPVTLVLSFCMQVAALAERQEPEEPETQAEAVEAFIEAGEEEGILEESDRELIQSVVEFGDKTAREVMTPRPDIFAVPLETTIERLHHLLELRPKSRVPVYGESIDDIRGILYTHDLLQVADTDAAHQTVGSLLRPAHFVPETKRTTDLLRELQRQKMQIAVVIDEYGGVAGIVTIEDLLEEIVGELHDEREVADIIREDDNTYVVPGTLDLGRLEDLFDFRPEEEDEIEAATVGGLITERMGHIAQPGETMEESGLRFEVLQSTDRRIERLRVSRVNPEAESQSQQVGV
ncbi:MAG TPA: hemolysin family protein [Terriglobales bacterium]|jgi:CBS domain containing-hemolysin-like protein